MGETGERHGFLSGVIEMVITVAVALAVALLLRTFVFEVYEVPTGSMLETIQEGDRLVGEKITYRYSEPKQGDIVTFSNPDGSDTTLIKRVIATGGQTVNLVDGVVYVDGVALDEPYTLGKASYPLDYSLTGVTMSYPYTVPEGSVWVMGDNRTNSLDSRYFGAVSVDDITSRAVFIFWPFSDAQTL